MKKYLLRYFALFVSMILVICLAGCGKNAEKLTTFMSYDDMDFDTDSQKNGIVCENERWRLCWDNSKKRVSFEDKLSGEVWGQIPKEATEPVYDENGRVKKNHPQLESVIQVIYQDPKSFDDVTAYSYSSAVQSDGVYAKKIKNGLEVTYDFMDNEFSVPVEYTIGSESFQISVNPKKISEGEELKIHSVAVAPFLCGIKNNSEESWLFIPDGTGAIIEPNESDGVGTVGEAYVYGKDLSYQSYTKSAPSEQIHFPVFGAKKGSSAILGIITSGAETAALEWSIGSANIGYSSVYPEFRIRGFNYIKRPENFVTTTTLGAFKILSEGIVTEKIKIEYFALNDDKASILGMAECYREYLEKNSKLKKSDNKERYATLKYVGAVVQPSFVLGIPSHKLFPLTTVNEAYDMTAEITEKTGNNVNVSFVGFGESGIDTQKLAGGFTVSRKLGGVKGMKKTAEKLRNKNIDSFMDFDIISFSDSADGFSKSDAAVYHGGQVVKYTSFDNVSRAANNDRFFVLSRDNLFKASNKVNGFANKAGLSGISYSSLSNTVYSDYSKQEYYISGKMAADVSEIFEDSKTDGRKILASGANVYAAVSSDYINDVPLYSSNYVITSQDVPFYQLIFKGLRPMSSVSVNLCANEKDALLRCVSSGISPSYTLYRNFDGELATSDHSFIFASEYKGNKKKVISQISSLESYLKSIADAKISDYARLDGGIVKTEFDNGVYVLVNFSDNDVLTEYGTVKAKDYITGRGDR